LTLQSSSALFSRHLLAFDPSIVMEKCLIDQKLDWLALSLIPGLGSVGIKMLVTKFGAPEAVFQATPSELATVEGLRKEIAGRITRREFLVDPSKVAKKIQRLGVRILTYAETGYPPLLREIHDPPMLLFLKGKEIPLNNTFISVVGSRNPTPYGLKTAEEIAQGLARRSLGIVSGMARGIDSAAHWGCLGGKGFTVAVLGTGIDVIYPASNKKLFEQITEHGAVITEFPLGTPPEPKNFPIRNRIISGLSKGTVVVEATKNSGSLITAELSLEQGREVFAVPGSVHSFKSTGCHHLIKQGAKLVENSDDVLDELGMNYPFAQKTDTLKGPPLPIMEDNEKTIFEIIGDFPLHIDEIAKEAGLEPGTVSSTLMKMELKGLVRQLPGKLFVR
jgi:DNA processing protein